MQGNSAGLRFQKVPPSVDASVDIDRDGYGSYVLLSSRIESRGAAERCIYRVCFT